MSELIFPEPAYPPPPEPTPDRDPVPPPWLWGVWCAVPPTPWRGRNPFEPVPEGGRWYLDPRTDAILVTVDEQVAAHEAERLDVIAIHWNPRYRADRERGLPSNFEPRVIGVSPAPARGSLPSRPPNPDPEATRRLLTSLMGGDPRDPVVSRRWSEAVVGFWRCMHPRTSPGQPQ